MTFHNTTPQKILAIDIGGSKLLTAVVETSYSNGRLEAGIDHIARRQLFRDSGREGVLREIDNAVAETLARADLTSGDLDGIGATIPGLADPRDGRWIYAPFSGIRDFPIGKILGEHYGLPVFAENDVNACAWAEHVFGVCRNVDDFLWITISNGIGGGLVLGGRIYPGHFGCAGEIGHFQVAPDGQLCGCGLRGCLEAEAAGPAIARRFAELLEKAGQSGKTDSLTPVEQYRSIRGIPADTRLSALDIAWLARAEHPLAMQTYETTGRLVGKAVALAANLINPEKIVIGGGVANAFDLLEVPIRETFQNECMASANSKVGIEKTGLGYEAGLFAAASLLFGR